MSFSKIVLFCSNNSLPITTRAVSNVTLLSEVISLTRLRTHISPRNKHVRLRESVDYEVPADQIGGDTKATLATQEDSRSIDSSSTLHLKEESIPDIKENQVNDCSNETKVASPCVSQELKSSSSATSDKDISNEKEELYESMSNEVGRGQSNVSNFTMTHVSVMSDLCSKSDPGCYSLASSRVSTATIRNTNVKETKEKKNRERLLAGPVGSDISLAAQDVELEMDYYDYNVINAGAAPGSYLGMDPAFLVWIPPLDGSGEILPENAEVSLEINNMQPNVFLDTGSNKESPEAEETILLSKITMKTTSESTLNESPILRAKNRKVQPLVFDVTDNRFNKPEIVPLVHNNRNISFQLNEFPKKLLSASKYSLAEMEKETKVEKSPSLCGSYLAGLKFADDEEEDQCNMDNSYRDSSVISSN